MALGNPLVPARNGGSGPGGLWKKPLVFTLSVGVNVAGEVLAFAFAMVHQLGKIAPFLDSFDAQDCKLARHNLCFRGERDALYCRDAASRRRTTGDSRGWSNPLDAQENYEKRQRPVYWFHNSLVRSTITEVIVAHFRQDTRGESVPLLEPRSLPLAKEH